MSAVFMDLIDHNSFLIIDVGEKLLKCDKLTLTERSLIFNYRLVVALQNGPYCVAPNTNTRLYINKQRLVELMGFFFFF
jgi:hypothetical protein